MCCHPALTRPSAIALTLRAVGGLTTAEIANAFLVPEATMAQRISRAKQRIKTSGVPFRMPTDQERAERLGAVLHVLYLIFNEGYASSIGPDLQRSDLSNEAIRLTRAVHNLLPPAGEGAGEVAGLLALMLLTDARRPARTGPDGELIPLAEQDRTLWDRAAISEGIALISATLSRGSIGSYQLQAAIAAVHDEAARAEDTDWPQILALVRLAQADVRQSHGDAQPRHRRGHGARSAGRTEAAGSARRRRTHGRPLSPRRRARASPRDGRRSSGRRCALPRGRAPDDEHSGAELPQYAGRPPSQPL